MNFKDRDFIKTLIEGLKLKEVNLSEPVILTQRIYLSSIRSFYDYSSEKVVSRKAKELCMDGLFESDGHDFELTELAKKL